jgi:hypothetical protein
MEETLLEKAARHVLTGAHILVRHRQLIAELEADGHDTTSAEALLETFIASQHIFEDHLKSLLKESGLSNLDHAAPPPILVRRSGESRQVKFERFARALSAGWMARATWTTRSQSLLV